MDTIRVVSGTGTGPTPTAAYDAALLSAGVGNYNLVTVSSVLPADARVETVGTAPDLGSVGDRLTVVQARAVDDAAAAALSWGHTDGGEGLFYEGSATSPAEGGPDEERGSPRERARREAERGLTAGFERRGWTAVERESVAVATEGGRHAAAVVLAVYGTGSSPF